MGEPTLCMTSSLTTGLKGPRFYSHRTPVPPGFTDTHPPSRPLRLRGTNAVWVGNIGKALNHRRVHRSSDGCTRFLKTLEELRVNGEG